MKGSELRQDPATKEWVVIAPERAKRPYMVLKNETIAPKHSPADCPFCPGNEAKTPPEVLRIPQGPDWQVRVVPNKFGALVPDAEPIRKGGFFRTVTGAGYHEVIVEHPQHDIAIVDMPEEHIVQILKAYQQRQRELCHDHRIQFVVIFRNYGARAGTSIAHPHSQLLATPVVPAYLRWKHEVAERYFDDTNRNLYSDILENEKTTHKRIVEENKQFTVFVPFAAAVPFEMWIMPHSREPSFGIASETELEELACVLRRSLRRLRGCCGNVHYNYVVHSCTTRDGAEEYYVWHLQIIPRLTLPAGFELGSHMYINPTSPEQCAEELRHVISTPIPEPHGRGDTEESNRGKNM
jgi:UDPglucose--hexose-1-phosphate uridylyltransferase